MGITTVNVLVPIQGDGPAVDVSMLVGAKTIVFSGQFDGAYDLLVTQDGVEFVPALSIKTMSIDQTIAGAFSAVKLRSRAQARGTVTCTISAVEVDNQNSFEQIASLAVGFNGRGPVVDTSAAFPPSGSEVDTCFLCDGVFAGALIIEGSNDGSNFEPLVSFVANPLPPDYYGGSLEFAPVTTDKKARYVRIFMDGQILSPTIVTLGGGVPAPGASPTGPAGGDLSGTYPDPTVKPLVVQTSVTVANLTALRAHTTVGGSVSLAGYYTPGDGGGGLFVWSSTSTVADDNGLVIKPTAVSGAGRWIRTYQGAPCVAFWGALGLSDDTVRLQNAINTCPVGRLLFAPITYTTSANLALRSGVSLQGCGATITYNSSWANGGTFLNITNLTDIEAIDFTFDGKGTWTSTPFANPYSAGNSVGFTNNHYGIKIAASNRVKIRNCTFVGLGNGLYDTGSQNLKIFGCDFKTLGTSAITMYGSKFSLLDHNEITSVLGNITPAGNVNVTDSKFADGVFLWSCQWITINNNVIDDIYRIGVVLEGDGITLNDGVVVSSNVIQNLHGARGTETNAAIWNESNQSSKTCIAVGNVCNNTTNPTSIGIVSSQMQVIGNNLFGFGTGIKARDCELNGNTIQSCGLGILVLFQLASQTTHIVGNKISDCKTTGITVYQSRGLINIIGANYIKDNGVGSSGADASGIAVNPYYNDQKVVISGNLFVSSAAQGAATGQLYAIMSIGGGDFTRTDHYISQNTFLFVGAWTAVYPDNLGVVPCAWAYYDTTTIYNNDVGNLAGNTSSKVPQTGCSTRSTNSPYIVGFASVAPSGSYRRGDIILNNNQAAGQPYGWECITTGNPATFKIISNLS